MKLRLIATALLCFAAGSVLAQPPGPRPGAADRMDNLAILLDLDAGQKVAVQKVLEEQHESMKTMHEQAKTSQQRPTREQMREQHEKLQTTTVEKLRAILSDVQLQKYQALMDMRPGPPMHRHMRRNKDE